MSSINAFGVAKDEAVQVFRHWPQFIVLAFVWSLIATAAVVAACIYFAVSEGRPIDIGQYLDRMADGDLTRQYTMITGFATLFGQLATAIGWTRLVLLDEQPRGWLHIPHGSARYLGRYLIVLFLCVVLAVPGVAIGGIVGAFVPGSAGRVAGAAIMGIGGLAAIYICLRMWLIFPAIALQDDSMTLRRSVQLTGRAPVAAVIAPLLSYVPFMVIAIIIDAVPALLPMGNIATVIAILAEFFSTFAILGAIAASSGVMAVLYAKLAPNSPALSQTAA
jgi:hypothetical protein